MANVSILPFDGASSLEVAYVAGVNLVSNMHTAERMEDGSVYTFPATRTTFFGLDPTLLRILQLLALNEFLVIL